MLNVLQGIGYIALAISDILAKDKPDFNAAYIDFMKGLGMIGLHQQIITVMAQEQEKEKKSQPTQKDT